MPTVRVSVNNWGKLVDAVRNHSGDNGIPEWSAITNYYSVCVPSIITPLSWKLWHLYQCIRGTRNETYRSFNDLPAFWVSACDVISGETARIDLVKEAEAKRKQQQLMRSSRRPRYGHK